MAYAPAALRWLADEWQAAIGSAVFSGIVGDDQHDYGYHRAANEIPTSDYSRQLVGDRDADGIDMDAADAIDMNMSKADMILVTRRVYDSWRDQADPRLNFWREVIGTLDGANVIYMDCQSGRQGTADDSHLWHMHAGGLRIHANNYEAMRALLSVIKGETVAQWQAGDDMALMDDPHGAALVWRVEALVNGRDVVAGGPTAGQPVWLVRTVKALATAVASIDEEVAAKLAAEFEQIDAAVAAGTAAVQSAADQTVQRVLAALPESGPVSREDLEAALRSVLGSLDAA